MDEEILSIIAEESGERIDALLARTVAGLSRSAAQRLIEKGAVRIGDRPVQKNTRCEAGTEITVTLPETEEVPLLPQEIPLDIVYEDGDLIVVNKPRGMVVHPAPGHPDGTLVNALLWHCGDSLSGIGGEKRPGIVHRIDKDTSGLLIAAKNDFAHQVNPEVRAHEVPTPTDAHPDVAVQPAPDADVHTVSDTSDVHVVEQQIAQNFDMGDDVHIVGYANAEGHLVVGYDSTGDGQADVAIIDMDGNLAPSDADVIMDREGNMARLGDLNNEPDPNQTAAMENPDVAPDMPDYMNDANIDDMNVLA